MPFVIAHAGHWLVQLLYVAPIVALGVVLLIGRLRERRERRTGPSPENQPRG